MVVVVPSLVVVRCTRSKRPLYVLVVFVYVMSPTRRKKQLPLSAVLVCALQLLSPSWGMFNANGPHSHTYFLVRVWHNKQPTYVLYHTCKNVLEGVARYLVVSTIVWYHTTLFWYHSVARRIMI
jgi:hypothetical protein